MSNPRVRSAYGPRSRVATVVNDPSLTVQSSKDECDINIILARYEKTGSVSHVRPGDPRYGDFSGVTDYHDALNRVIEANDSFMALPASLRSRFDNDPGLFLDFVHDPANMPELVKLGLVEAPPAPVSGGAASAPQVALAKPLPRL